MRKPLLILVLLQLLSIILYAQSPTSTLATIVNDHFEGEISKNAAWFGHHPPKNPEALICLIRTDSIGKIAEVQWLADDTFKDTAYIIFKRLETGKFDSWQNSQYKNVTFLIPIYVLPAKMTISEIKKRRALRISKKEIETTS